jgi:hypothetical protein
MNGIVRKGLVVLLALGCAGVGMTAPGDWTLGTVGPSARYRPGSATDGTYIYVFGGSTGVQSDEMWRWDPATGNWTQLASMPTAKMNHQGAYWDGKIYVPGGYTGAHITEMAIYDIATDTWSTGMPEPAPRTGTTIAYDGKIYVFGGNPGPSAETLIYDIGTDSWTYGAPMPAATTYGRAIRVGAYGYYVGGIAGATTAAVHRYDIMDDSWTTVAPLQTPRTSCELMTDGMNIYAVNGGDASYWTGVPLAQTVEIYDVGADSWSYGNPTLTTTAAPAGGFAGGKFMIMGGTSGGVNYDTVQVAIDDTSLIFADGFESGDTTAWSSTVP